MAIPHEAWGHVRRAVFHDGHLILDIGGCIFKGGGPPDYILGSDPEAERWLSCFRTDNLDEWLSACVLCPRAPEWEGVMVRFDDVDRFVDHGYTNPYRKPGVPDWYFFWTKHFTMGVLRRWCRAQGLLPVPDLPYVPHTAGCGITTGLRGEADGLLQTVGLNGSRPTRR